MPFALMHGESLVAVASWALGEAGADLFDFDTPWSTVQAHETALVVHDLLCPGTPVAFLSEAVALSAEEDVVVVGVRPVTDTIKTVDDGVVGETVDRSALVTVTSPVVLPARVVAALDDWPELTDIAALVEELRGRFEVRMLEAPSAGRRVADASDLRLLEADASPRPL